MLTGRRIAVTGAAGFIGSRLVSALVGAGAEVLALVRDDAAQGSLHQAQVEHCRLVLPEVAECRSQLRGIDAICHAAAFVPRDMADSRAAEECLRTNALGTLRLMEAAVASGIKHFVNLSAGTMYIPRGRPVNEDDEVFPSTRASYYLTSKMAGEIFATFYARSHPIRLCNLRAASVYGPGMRQQNVVARFITLASQGSALPLIAGGRTRSDLVFVDDVVFAMLCVLRERIEGTLNIGSGEATSVAELAGEILQQCGREPSETDCVSGPSQMDFAALDVEKARRLFGYQPTSLRAGIARTLAELGVATAPAQP